MISCVFRNSGIRILGLLDTSFQEVDIASDDRRAKRAEIHILRNDLIESHHFGSALPCCIIGAVCRNPVRALLAIISAEITNGFLHTLFLFKMTLLQFLAAYRAIGNADDLLASAGTEVSDSQHTLAVHSDLQEAILCRLRIDGSEIIVVSATEGTGLTASRSTLYDVPEPLLRYDMLFGSLFTRPDDVSVVTHSIYSPETDP